MLRSLWVGILIAVPSGAGVALSVLGGNIGSLVGVAISASLLPPAVNAVSHSYKLSNLRQFQKIVNFSINKMYPSNLGIASLAMVNLNRGSMKQQWLYNSHLVLNYF